MAEHYALERDMTPVVEAWLRAQGMVVRREVYMPYGICDLVGCELDEENVRRRVATGYKARSSRQCLRDIECGRPWLPLHRRLVFVELKLSRTAEVWRQAARFQAYGESWVAMPYPACEYRPRDGRLFAAIGVLRVDGGVIVERPARPNLVVTNCQTLRVVDSIAMGGEGA
ncbi:MAG: hypothetical protein JXA57_10640 [Armatimonadetes bacterium]|nr:hypothetical protein [Armatimonadota bacterium]